MRTQMFIDGQWRSAASGKALEVINPATEEVIATVAAADRKDIDDAVAAARAALDGPWGNCRRASADGCSGNSASS